MFAKIPRYVQTKTLVLLKTTFVSLFYMMIRTYFMTKKTTKFPKVQRGDGRTGEMRRDKGALSIMREIDNGLKNGSFQCHDCRSVMV